MKGRRAGVPKHRKSRPSGLRMPRRDTLPPGANDAPAVVSMTGAMGLAFV